MPDNRGVFLSETHRMHPDVCGFISEQIYQGRLGSHPECRRQSTVAGTGLRWLRAEHNGNTASSVEEAELIADEIWSADRRRVDRLQSSELSGGKRFYPCRPVQRSGPRRRGSRDSRTADVPVGTVDKFQGREAVVVFFSIGDVQR